MPNRSRTRPGFALAIALGAIVIIGAIVTGMFFASTQEYRISRNSAMQARALTTAEYGLNRILTTGQWDPAWNTAAAGFLADSVYLPGDGGLDSVRVSKLADGLFLLTSTGRVGPASGAQARHRLGALVTLAIPKLNMLGALTTQGSVKIGGSSFLDGNDSTVDNWGCPPATSGLPGLSMPDISKIQTPGCNNLDCIAGTPKLAQNAAAGNDSTYFSFGPGLDWNSLTSMASASKTLTSGGTINGLAPSVSGGVCNTADPNNWGDPMHTSIASCQAYFPIIHALGNLQLTGGAGQGILLVDGDLTITGGAHFYGPVIVKGSLKSTGSGGHVTGGVMAANVDLEQSSLLGDAEIQFSSCALSRALSGAAAPMFLARRSWTELY